MATTATKLMTAEEFMDLPAPADGSKQELVRGEIVTMPPTKQPHGFAQIRIGWLLMNVVEPNRLGWVGSESGTITERDPDTVRGPDVYFFSIERMPERPTGYADIAPDLVVEIRSPSDRSATIREKVREYLAAGTRLVWVVDPETRTVMVYAGNMRGLELDESETITGGEVLPTFTCKVADFFG
jgi:Uma2 family endonuclease